MVVYLVFDENDGLTEVETFFGMTFSIKCVVLTTEVHERGDLGGRPQLACGSSKRSCLAWLVR